MSSMDHFLRPRWQFYTGHQNFVAQTRLRAGVVKPPCLLIWSEEDMGLGHEARVLISSPFLVLIKRLTTLNFSLHVISNVLSFDVFRHLTTFMFNPLSLSLSLSLSFGLSHQPKKLSVVAKHRVLIFYFLRVCLWACFSNPRSFVNATQP